MPTLSNPHELVINLHMHTTYSDGSGSHTDLAKAAMRAGLDAIIVTDHNVWVDGLEDYYQSGDKKVLVMVGEEIHDQAREPQKNHLLVFGARRELATLAPIPQELLDGVSKADGLAFFAHPYDPPAPAVGEDDLSWVNWEVSGYTGIELWNGFSEFKNVIKSKLHALYYILNPHRINRNPQPEMLQKWDELLKAGKRVVAIGGSDAHENTRRLGPWKLTIFPYEFHFRTVNTHLLVPQPLSGGLQEDTQMILEALREGHAFVGFDLPAKTRGFRFYAQGKDGTAWMGDEISSQGGVTFQIRLPLRTECRLLKDGVPIKTWTNRDNCTHIATETGVYRVEAYIEYLGLQRGWIFSNPIYVTE
jgi:hypothetical protein